MALYGGITLPGKPDLSNVQKLDLLPMEAIAEMQRTGMAIDKEWFSQLSTQLDGEIKELRREICDYIPPEKLDEFTARANMSENEDSDDPDSDSSLPMNVGSTQQLSKLLFDVLGIGKGRTLKMTKSGSQISTGKKELEKFKREHPVVVKVLSYKERVKLKNTYSDSIPLKSVLHKAGTCWCGDRHWYPSDRIHSTILTTRTSTGRLACVAEWTKIRTNRGDVQIKDVVVGDLVWTHKQRWKPVTAKWIKGWEQMYHVTFSNGNVLTCTESHRLLVYRNEYIKTLVSNSFKHRISPEEVQESGQSNIATNSRRVRNDLSYGSLDLQPQDVQSGIQSISENQVCGVEDRREEPTVRKEGGIVVQMDRRYRRWERLSDYLKGRETAICPSYCDGGSTGAEGIAGYIRCTSHRPRHETQRTGQFGTGDNSRPSESSLHDAEGQFICSIEKITPAGSLEVYDISVADDESYAACGVFNHNSKNPNLQNIPARSELGRRVRAGFIPSRGMRYGMADFGQFEMRLGADYSHDENLVRIFRCGLDPHTDTAMRAFKQPKHKVDHMTCLDCEFKSKNDTDIDLHKITKHTLFDGRLLYRAPCKNVGFGVFYGLSPEGLYDLMLLTYATAGLDVPEWLTLEWCEQFIEDWFDLYPKVREYMDNQFYRAQRYGIVWTMLGRIRRVPEVRSVHPRIVSAGLRQAGNMPVQGTQADLNKIAIAEVYQDVVKWARAQGVECRILMSIHDEIILEAEEEYAEMLVWRMEEVMSRVMVDRDTGMDMSLVPIVADGKTVDRWKK